MNKRYSIYLLYQTHHIYVLDHVLQLAWYQYRGNQGRYHGWNRAYDDDYNILKDSKPNIYGLCKIRKWLRESGYIVTKLPWEV